MKSKKKESMQIKRPSLKGMKNTKYLGHFAQDKYIQKGHNLSGVFDVYRPPSAIELMAPANPFSAVEEKARRTQQMGLTSEQLANSPTQQELVRQEEQAAAEISNLQPLLSDEEQKISKMQRQPYGGGFDRGMAETRARSLRERISKARQTVSAGMARKKKFIEEL